MEARYTVGEGREFNYPANEVSEQILKNAGGRSKLSDAEKELVSYKTVVEGQDCSDMPKEVLELYVERGWVIDSQAKTEVLAEDLEKSWADLGRPSEEEMTNE